MIEWSVGWLIVSVYSNALHEVTPAVETEGKIPEYKENHRKTRNHKLFINETPKDSV